MTSIALSTPSPISIPTSETWDSDGSGLWSTFVVDVGTPPQPARVLISTSNGETWVVGPEGCPAKYGDDCADSRGMTFQPDNSTTWTEIGLYELDLELNLGYTGNGQYGHDTVTLGYPGSGAPSLEHQVVAGIASPDFWLGSFGLDPAPRNFTNLNDPQPSFLQTLKNTTVIPSLSWAYTAGAAYRYDKVQGSLILGGYDTSRFSPQNLTFDMYEDVTRRFIVDLASIAYVPAGSSTTIGTTLTFEKISMFIDSTIPDFYLPIDICARFEEVFGLQWNDTSQIYTLNETMHTTMLSMNPDITFTLSNLYNKTLDISLPYSAFDLNATFPIANQSTYYFPLRRASNDTMYTLGRVFLQEAYLIADYQRFQFSVAPCAWPPVFTPQIAAILPPTENSIATTSVLPGASPSKSTTISIAAIAGIVMGGVVLISLILVLGLFLLRRWEKVKEIPTISTSVEVPPPTSATYPRSPDGMMMDFIKSELEDRQLAEMDGTAYPSEIETPSTPFRHELDSKGYVSELGTEQVFEMSAMELKPKSSRRI
ncbi:hypothetical protein G7Y89_g14808 [Cudoniella acicularis]|uniref:Peptidase A1 domain-containing protein n=1 Tax=Cudoniella acicularis TaxID=354080 RepID=A0A8H4QWW8_9HELO|nr:hypothetical protein G7Y89_g14808 [Cudoniella acicularis]